jgi:hypothetical protein
MRALTLLLLSFSTLSGSNPVGYRQFTLLDAGRPAASITASSQSRKVAVSLWYPARQTRHKRTWLSYFQDEAQLRESLPPSAPLARIQAALQARPSLAATNAPALPSKYLILIAASPALIAPVAEHLALHGYTVAAVEAQGSFEANFIASLPDLQSLIEDLQFVRARVGAALPYTCLGHAIGATACAGLAMRDWSMKAVISWEGGLPTPFEQGLLRQLPFFDAAAFRAPLLLLHAPHPAVRPDLLNPFVFTPQRRAAFPDSSEGHFLVWGALEADVPGLLGEPKPKAPASFQRALDYGIAFLDKYLKGGSAEQAPAEVRSALPFRASLPELRDLLRREGVAGLRKLSAAMRPQVRLSPAKLEALSQWLSWQPEPLKSQVPALEQLRMELESIEP